MKYRVRIIAEAEVDAPDKETAYRLTEEMTFDDPGNCEWIRGNCDVIK